MIQEPSHRETSLIAEWPVTLAAFLAGCIFFTAIGLPLACAIAPSRMPPLALAPTLGWAAYATLGLPVLTATGFTPTHILVFTLAITGAAWLPWHLRDKAKSIGTDRAALPPIFLLLAAIMALAPLTAIMPKPALSGILLSPPMFDHVKIAIVDAVLRSGLPVPNPFIGPANPGHLAYYYLWHVSTAMVAATLHIGGWAAEAAMTGFTAYASLVLIMGLVIAMGGGIPAILAAMILSLPGSMRPILAFLAGPDAANAIIPRSADIGAWLNQSAWVPQHLASATCVIIAMLLMQRAMEAGTMLGTAALGICVAAGFESSIWVGGFACAAAGLTWGTMLLAHARAAARPAFMGHVSAAGLLALCLILPMLVAEFHAVQARHAGGGIAFSPYQVFGDLVPPAWRGVADLPGFWLVLIPFDLPAIVPYGLAWLWYSQASPKAHHTLLHQFAAVMCMACLSIAWLFRSTLENNDLGWRAFLPPIMLLTACAGCGLGMLAERRKWGLAAAGASLALLGVPDAARIYHDYTHGQLPGDAAGFAQAEPLWQAVRRIAGPNDRIANNPRAVAAATPWPVNIAWAILSDRPSCYAGWATVIAYGTLPKPALIRLDNQMQRVFDGHAQPDDLGVLAQAQDCAVAVITPADGAWINDPFATSQAYRLADSTPAWRIYRRRAIVSRFEK